MRPQTPVGPIVGVTGGVPKREAWRRPVGFEPLAELEETVKVGWDRVEASFVQRADAIIDAGATDALRERNPVIAMCSVLAAHVVPAPVFAAEIIRKIIQSDKFVGELVRIVIGADDNVRPGANVGSDRRLWPNVLPTFGVEPHLDSSAIGEAFSELHEAVVLGFDEVLPTQNSDLSAGLGRVSPGRFRAIGRLNQEGCAGSHHGRGGDATFEGIASGYLCHRTFLRFLCVRPCARPLSSARWLYPSAWKSPANGPKVAGVGVL